MRDEGDCSGERGLTDDDDDIMSTTISIVNMHEMCISGLAPDVGMIESTCN